MVVKAFNSSRIRILISSFFTYVDIFSTIQIFLVNQLTTQVGVDEFTAHMVERIPTTMNAYQIPGVNFAVIKDRKIIWTKAFGYADLATETPMTLETPLRIQSISNGC